MAIPNISGTMTMGYVNKPDYKQFCEYYRATIEYTDRQAHVRPVSVVQYNNTTHNATGPEIVSSEKVFGVFLTESMLNQLVENQTRILEERDDRAQNPMLMDMWNKYQMMRQMYK